MAGRPLESPKNSADLFSEGNQKAKSNDYAGAIECYDQAIQSDPNNYKIWHNKGVILKRMGDLEKSNSHLNRAKELKNKNFQLMEADEPDTGNNTEQQPNINQIPVPPYSGNLFLYYIAPLIAAFLLFGGLPGVFASTFFLGFCAFIDASGLEKRANTSPTNSDSWKTWHWGLLVFFTWLIGYLIYLFKRRELYETRNNLPRTAHSVNNVVLVGVIFFIAIGFSIMGLQVNSGYFEPSSSQYSSPTASQYHTSAPSSLLPTQTQELKFDFKHQDVTSESVKLALIKMDPNSPGHYGPGFEFGKNGTAEILDTEVYSLNNGKKSVIITYYVGSVWNSWHFMLGATTTSLAIYYNLFKNGDIDEITVISATTLVDKYGKENVEPVLTARMTRSTAEKVDWDNLIDLMYGNYHRFFSVVDSYEINPGVAKSIAECDGFFCA